MKPFPKAFPLTTMITLAVIALAAAAGLVQTVQQLNKLVPLRRERPFVFAGIIFEGARGIIAGEKYVGYLTDRDIKGDKNAAARFAHAQMALAPIILDLNNPGHRLLIIDCQNPQVAAVILAKIKARPLRQNGPGLIIAERMAP
ncbi:MAG: hypothetical protein HQL18_01430 [Candidatus Omnitrophica bacterium]|nr:hypothetical protein [Candidatus Omnitrophota bacterium]